MPRLLRFAGAFPRGSVFLLTSARGAPINVCILSGNGSGSRHAFMRRCVLTRNKGHTMKQKKMQWNSGWCFAIVNGKLAEIFFEKGHGIWGYCFVKREAYSAKEQKMIDADIKRCRFTYRKGWFTNQIDGTRQRRPSMRTIFPKYRKEDCVSFEELKRKLKI